MPETKDKQAAEHKTMQLLEAFAEAAQWWGWAADQGNVSQTASAAAEYEEAKKAMIDRIHYLHTELSKFKHNRKPGV